MKWISTAALKPRPGSLVKIKTRRATCTCSGYDDREVYYDGKFQGIKNQNWVDKWMYSEMNDTLTDEAKRLITPEPCKNCVNV